jgi:hypothetical protein
MKERPQRREIWSPTKGRVEVHKETENGRHSRTRYEESDSKGRYARIIWKDLVDKEVERCVYEYDEKGRCIGKVYTAPDMPKARRYKTVFNDEEGSSESYWEDVSS